MTSEQEEKIVGIIAATLAGVIGSLNPDAPVYPSSVYVVGYARSILHEIRKVET